MQLLPHSGLDRGADTDLAAIRFSGFQTFKRNHMINPSVGLSMQEVGGMWVSTGGPSLLDLSLGPGRI